MNALTKIETTALAPMTETELIAVLQSSLYPGAKLESIKMVLGYCKASGLDPMKKPVHIVPMKVATGRKDEKGWDIKETRDVIMPGVGMYRTEASRTGQYAGVSEPEFGPMRELEYSADVWSEGENGRRQKRTEKKTLAYPEWCRVTVERIVNGSPRQFTAKEFWLENYATRGSDGAPNEMWSKRPMGQLSKCAEAQALRKAFPDTTGAQPTAEEMEGKALDDEGEQSPPVGRKPPVSMPHAKATPAATGSADVSDAQVKGEPPGGEGDPAKAPDTTLATVGEIAYLLKKIAAKETTIAAAREEAQLAPGDKLDGITKDEFVALKDVLK